MSDPVARCFTASDVVVLGAIGHGSEVVLLGESAELRQAQHEAAPVPRVCPASEMQVRLPKRAGEGESVGSSRRESWDTAFVGAEWRRRRRGRMVGAVRWIRTRKWDGRGWGSGRRWERRMEQVTGRSEAGVVTGLGLTLDESVSGEAAEGRGDGVLGEVELVGERCARRRSRRASRRRPLRDRAARARRSSRAVGGGGASRCCRSRAVTAPPRSPCAAARQPGR